MFSIEEKKKKTQCWFENLRDQICSAFEEIEQNFCQSYQKQPGSFKQSSWQRAEGGGGVISLMKGSVFEKVGVNISTVWGEFSPKFRSEIPGAKDDPRFWASGISVVAHMTSPLVPAVHMNTRHIVTSKSWFGGGTDMTPYYPYDQDTQDFHYALEKTCNDFDPESYPKYKKWCDEYFYLAHRKEPRGIGGIFYDYLATDSWEKDFDFTQQIGLTFLDIYTKIVRKRMNEVWTPEQRLHQLERRGRYVEFNLLYDRGTRFGLMTEGNVEAILMSLPPEVRWP